MDRYHLHTVCREANCPNRMECFDSRTATFLILGSVCTRNCTFCNITKGEPETVDPEEPKHIADAVETLGLRYAVITSVTRDDLPDGGAGHFAAVVQAVKARTPEVMIELLIPDFKGDRTALEKAARSGAEVLNHNVETVPSLYPSVRPLADYKQSLSVIRNAKEINPNLVTKSGIMLGLGEREDEVTAVLEELRDAGCDLLTIGQYLAPSDKHHPVVEYIHPDVFEQYAEKARVMGFTAVASAPFVRSSYKAAEMALKAFEAGNE
jgi:lipoic acid synthetase